MSDLKKIKEELDKITKEHKQMKDEIVKGQTTLHGIRKQQVEVGKELDEANSRLYNSKQELDKKDKNSFFTKKLFKQRSKVISTFKIPQYLFKLYHILSIKK